MQREHIHFVTGRLAEVALRRVLAELAPKVAFDYSVQVLGISVAALLTAPWVARRIQVQANCSRVILPGYCNGNLDCIAQAAGVPVELGPKDLRDLPAFFGQAQAGRRDYGAYDIEILAEINHAPRRALADMLAEARRLKADGADVIDLGCDPGDTWTGVEDAVKALRAEGLRVSIDSMNRHEVEEAVRAGAELVLSVNAANRTYAADWGCEVVVIPDSTAGATQADAIEQIEQTVAVLSHRGVPLRVDPILEPIGFGFAASLGRFLEARQRLPDVELMMGIGNLTELVDADSAAVNVLLLGFCQELRIKSVLTTQVINWARTSVRECDLARRLVYHAVKNRVLPKHLEPELLLLRDPKIHSHGAAELERLARTIRDPNYRLFAEGDFLHVIRANLHLQGDDPFDVFERLCATDAERIDAKHAFYLGYEAAKAMTALALGKQYTQDEPLCFGFLTRPEHRRQRPNLRSSESHDATTDTG